MSNKTWIKIKRGLILDPKHRRKMGESRWLYDYMIDKANWESGQIHEWVDRYAADEMELPLATLRKHRYRLEEEGYISSVQNKHSQTITIHNWTNPREYSGKVYNKKNKGDQPGTPSKKAKGNRKGDHKGNHKDDHKVIGGVDTPTSNSHTTNHTPQNQEEEANPISAWAKLMGGTINGFHVDEITALEKEWTDHAANLPDQHPDKDKQAAVVLCDAIRVTGLTADRPNLKYLVAVVENWRKHGIGWEPGKRKTKKAKAMEETKDVFQRARDKNL